jgi:translation elongation factor EF-1alpha
MGELLVGRISHFYHKINVAVVELTNSIKVGDKIRIVGHGTDFTQQIESIQIEHHNVEEAHKGQSIGLKVHESLRPECKVYLVND